MPEASQERSGADDLVGPIPKKVLVAPALYTMLLIVAPVLWHTHKGISIFDLTIPGSAVWAGALGGLLLSFQGIFYNNQRWRTRYNLWHCCSAVVGAGYGITGYMILAFLTTKSSGGGTPDPMAGALAAFVLGYCQRQFHALIIQIFTLIFQPANSDKTDRQ